MSRGDYTRMWGCRSCGQKLYAGPEAAKRHPFSKCGPTTWEPLKGPSPFATLSQLNAERKAAR